MGKSWTLTILTGVNKGKVFAVRGAGRYVIGRANGEIQLPGDGLVSSTHAELVVEGDSVVLRDLKSRNGVLLNGKKISSAFLGAGDRILLGDIEATWAVRVEAAAVPRSPAASEAPLTMSSSAKAMGFAGVSAPMPEESPPPPVTMKELKSFAKSAAPRADSFAADALFETLLNVFFGPHQHFEKIDDDSEDTGFAVAFALICVGLQVAISIWSMSAGLTVDTIGFGPRATAISMGLGSLWLVLGNLVLIPASAILVQGIVYVSGGSGTFRSCLKIACYSRAPLPMLAVAACVPTYGPTLKFALLAYVYVILGIGVLKVFKGDPRRIATCTAAVLALAVGGTWLAGERPAENSRTLASARTVVRTPAASAPSGAAQSASAPQASAPPAAAPPAAAPSSELKR